ncbi:MAG TPA: LytR C-terminal domain-containing protein [Aquihabitans sp.]|jgi:hypothetical protein|nr:LytR C-terminal domain-containing protein [Aquihabitans sp.]
MTSEPPRTARRNRPDTGFRRRALGLPDPVGAPAGAPAEAAGAAPARPRLRDELAAIPDLDRSPAAPAGTGAGGSTATLEREAEPAPVVGSHGDDPGAADDDGRGSDADGPTDLGGPPRARHDRVRRVPPWRRAGFALALVALVAAIPVLASTGYELVTESRDGTEGNAGAGPNDPGYEELVTSTPTAVVVQTDADGRLVGVTFLSLGAESGGGSVIFVPVETLIANPGFGVDRLRTSYDLLADDPDAAAQQVSDRVAEILNVGIDEVIQLDDAGWSNVVEPVAPFSVDNLDTLDLGGLEVPPGPIQLGADLVGRYLGTKLPDEEEPARIARQEQVWRGWLAAVAASGREDAVPGETGSGLGLFARTLAEGSVGYATLPVDRGPGEKERYEPDEDALKQLIAEAVPAPDAAAPGSRRTVRLLNGVAPGPIPTELVQQVAALDGSVTVVGNGPSFDRGQTTIVYVDERQAAYADALKVALGAKGSVKLDREAPDTIDVTVVLGRDVLGDLPTSSTPAVPGAPAPTAGSTVPPSGEN